MRVLTVKETKTYIFTFEFSEIDIEDLRAVMKDMACTSSNGLGGARDVVEALVADIVNSVPH